MEAFFNPLVTILDLKKRSIKTQKFHLIHLIFTKIYVTQLLHLKPLYYVIMYRFS